MIVDKIMESNGILSVLWITNFEKALLRLFKLISVDVKKILPFINPLWFFALAFFYSHISFSHIILLSRSEQRFISSNQSFYVSGAEALQSHVVREEMYLGFWYNSYLLLRMAGQRLSCKSQER